jgi:hypothetical protein
MLPPPCLVALPVLTDQDPEPHAGATVTFLAILSQLQHAFSQFIVRCPMPWGRGSKGRRRLARHRAILRRNHYPGSIHSLLIASLLVITIAAGPRLTLCSYGCPGGAADDRTEYSTAATIESSTQDCAGSATDDRSA